MSKIDLSQNPWPLGEPFEFDRDDGSFAAPVRTTAPVTVENNKTVRNVSTSPVQPNGHSPANIAVNRPRPTQPDPVKKQHLAEEAFSEIISNNDGLFVRGKGRTLHCVFARQFQRCVHAWLDKRYNKPSYYLVYFVGTEEPLVVSEKTFNNPSLLSKKLSEHFNTPVKHYGSQTKTNTLLQSFFASKVNVVEVPFYFGWTFDVYEWKYYLWKGKTHASSDMDISDLVDAIIFEKNSDLLLPNASIALVAATQTADMMYAISNDNLRNVLWVSLHAAALYSFFVGYGFRIPVGVCLSCNNSNSLMTIEHLLSWYGDEAIELSSDKNIFRQLLKERCDQPLVIWDAKAHISNSQLLIQGIQTGSIEQVRKDSSVSLELTAMPFVLSSGDTKISLSSAFIPLEIESSDLADDAYAAFISGLKYFEDYLKNFLLHVEKNQNQLLYLFEECMRETIGPPVADALSSKEHLLTLRLFRTVRAFIKHYYKHLSPSCQNNERMEALFTGDAEQFLIESLQKTYRYQDSNETVKTLFFSAANQKLSAGDFDLRRMGDENINAPCDDGKEGIVFWDRTMAGFTQDAFRAVCTQCGYSTRQVAQALADTKTFIDRPLNGTTYMSKLFGATLQTKAGYVPVYKFNPERLALPKTQAVKLKATSECDFTLQLGSDINGTPMVWRGGNNSHLCLTGSTGSGKSFFLKGMTSQLTAQNVRCIIFDTAGDFSVAGDGNPDDWPPPGTEIVNIDNNQTQINPFMPLYPGESNEGIMNRFVDLLAPMLKLGPVQDPMLRECILSALDDGQLSNLSDLNKVMAIYKLSPNIAQKVRSLFTRLPHGDTPLKWNLDEPGVTILNLHNHTGDEAIKILLEMLLSNIFSLRVTAPQQSYPPVVLVLDECQLLNWSNSSFISQIMSRGRKYGLAAWLSTQYLHDKKMTQAIEQADLRVYFKPTNDDIPKITKRLAVENKLRKQYEESLRKLKRGQFLCIVDDEVRIAAPPV